MTTVELPKTQKSRHKGFDQLFMSRPDLKQTSQRSGNVAREEDKSNTF